MPVYVYVSSGLKVGCALPGDHLHPRSRVVPPRVCVQGPLLPRFPSAARLSPTAAALQHPCLAGCCELPCPGRASVQHCVGGRSHVLLNPALGQNLKLELV